MFLVGTVVQLLQAKAAATEINTIFQSCCRDLETIAQFVGKDLRFNIGLLSQADKDNIRARMLKLFKNFTSHSPYYIQIRFLDPLGQDVIHSPWIDHHKDIATPPAKSSLQMPLKNGGQPCYVSKIFYSESHQGYVAQFSRPFLFPSTAG